MPSYIDRRFVIFDVSELNLINFEEVYETSIETVRKSIDETKTFVKYKMPQPTSVASLTTKSQEYTYEEILQILSGPEWTNTEPIDEQ
jgi:hypothetical protein